jgi:hypothetical protein
MSRFLRVTDCGTGFPRLIALDEIRGVSPRRLCGSWIDLVSGRSLEVEQAFEDLERELVGLVEQEEAGK